MLTPILALLALVHPLKSPPQTHYPSFSLALSSTLPFYQTDFSHSEWTWPIHCRVTIHTKHICQKAHLDAWSPTDTVHRRQKDRFNSLVLTRGTVDFRERPFRQRNYFNNNNTSRDLLLTDGYSPTLQSLLPCAEGSSVTHANDTSKSGGKER